MNKNAIQRFAIWARTELISQVSQRAYQYDITADGYGEYNAEAVGGRLLSDSEKKQRQQLIHQIQSKGYTQVMEEVAYTWFNRFIALRFMEVNNYLPSHIRVFSDASGAFKPEILSNALHLDLDGLNMEKVSDLIEKNQTEDLYRYLLLTQCNALNTSLPRMFEKMGSYTELLLPNNILRQDGILGRMVTDIPEEDWTDQVQIIGWLYQYYNTELFANLYDGEKATDKILSQEIPCATQLFTPDWIIQYMVENSLGRLWIEGHPDDELKAGWKYYLEEAEQEPDVQAQLETIRAEYRTLRPQDIKVIDPCMGSGHILVYAFDVLVQIYKRAGFSERDAAQSILENNLYGLDIDDRAAQLAYFAVMMKARQYDRRFFTRNIQPHVYAIAESKDVCVAAMWRLGHEREIAERLIMELKDAKEYGSILNLSITIAELTALRKRLLKIDKMYSKDNLQDIMESIELFNNLLPLVEIAETMTRKYNVIVTNPPYLNANRMNSKLSTYIAKEYKEAKQDLSMVMYQAAIKNLAKRNGYVAFITPTSWMFSAKFKQIRKIIVKSFQIVSLVDCGTELFDGKIGHLYIAAWITQKTTPISSARYVDVTEYCYSKRAEKETQFFNVNHQGYFHQQYFQYMPDMPIAYNINDDILSYFTKGETIADFGVARQGLTTSDNNRFTRNWFEINKDSICFTCDSCDDTIENGFKWYPFLKGGLYQKWYPRFDTVVNYSNNGLEIKALVLEKYPYLNSPGFVVKNTEWYFKAGICWNDVAGERFNARIMPKGYIFADASPSFFPNDGEVFFYLAYMNSNVFQTFANVICQGLHYSTGQIPKIPCIEIPKKVAMSITFLAKKCYAIMGEQIKSYETSIEFIRHPFVNGEHLPISLKYTQWENECAKRVSLLKEYETKINELFSEAYGLSQIVGTSIDNFDLSASFANQSRDIKALISFAVGCILGRYSHYIEGLLFAGGQWDYETIVEQIVNSAKQNGFELRNPLTLFLPDSDNIIPICDDDYFDDDITDRFIKWIEVVFGKENLEDNLRFIAESLDYDGKPREVLRKYFLDDTRGFYADHLKAYQKRPIYWLFDSGKKNGFKALIYMHRYQSDLLARLRTDYVHEQQERYRTQLKHIGDAMDSASASERVKLAKQQKKLQEQALELQKYEEKVHHLADQNIKIDLDDGVKHNYALFEDVLAKIR